MARERARRGAAGGGARGSGRCPGVCLRRLRRSCAGSRQGPRDWSQMARGSRWPGQPPVMPARSIRCVSTGKLMPCSASTGRTPSHVLSQYWETCAMPGRAGVRWVRVG
eukprot:1331443-Rhodomonas_salina.2